MQTSQRIQNRAIAEKVVSAETAAALVSDNMVIAVSGFTPAGYPKAVPQALAERAKKGEKIGITLLTGASVGPEIDRDLTETHVIKRRFPYQNNKAMRDAINAGVIEFADIHLSHLPVWMKNGYFGDIDLAIVEAAQVDEEGRIYPTTSVGISNVAVRLAKRVVIEVNSAQPLSLVGIHDIYDVEKPPLTQPIPLTAPNQRIGLPYISCDPEKIAAVVLTDIPDSTVPVAPVDETSEKIAGHLIEFLHKEVSAGRLPRNLHPLQSGVGSVANAVLSGLVRSDFEHLFVYSEVLQDSVLDLIDAGKVDFASATSLTLSPERFPYFYRNIDQYRDKILLRPQEISNHPEIIRRLGLIAMNTAIEADIYGNVNSTHIGGTRLMNGIGGSADFARNAGISIFLTESTAKDGLVSSIVPAVTHVDHNEHSVQVIATEQGVADLRGLGPVRRAREIIDHCAHPKFKSMLESYFYQACERSKYKHIPL
ncbi:MAG: succinate CoA transferase [Synergistaceae bacterium]|jgi:succinyl-CoA:acetate CoA-transferase|nr:succinate CoA transferase [Synergistaceae bacterium]